MYDDLLCKFVEIEKKKQESNHACFHW